MREVFKADKTANEVLVGFFEFYTSGGFGNKLKSEIDLYVFGIVLDDYKAFGFDRPIEIFSLNKSQLNTLANKLKINMTKLLNLLERYKLTKSQKIEQVKFIEILKDNLSNFQNNENLKKGKIYLYLPNKIFKQEIEIKLSEINFIPDYSHNRDVLVIDWLSILYLLNIPTSDFFELIKSFKIEDNEIYKDFMNEYNKKSLNEVLVGFSKKLLNRYFGDGSDELIEVGKYIFDIIKR
jgi:hypothetical protein